MNSSIDGRILPVMVTTASAAAATESNDATTVQPRCCGGSSFSVTSVTTPSVPSLPTNNFVRLSPATSFSRGPPRRTAVPSASTTCMPEHVVGRHAVLHAAQAAGVGGDVAADAADLVRRRVGRIPQPVLGDGLLDLGVEQPRLRRRRCGSRGRRRCRASARSTARCRRRAPWRRRTVRCPRRGARPAPGARSPTASPPAPPRCAAAGPRPSRCPRSGRRRGPAGRRRRCRDR